MQGGLEPADGPGAFGSRGTEASTQLAMKYPSVLVSLQPGPKQAINTAEIKAQGCLLVTPVNYATTGGQLRILFKKKGTI